jgi:gluconate kinase
MKLLSQKHPNSLVTVVPNRLSRSWNRLQRMFAGGSLTDEDKIAFMDEIQSLYLDSKRRAKKFTPKKYLKNQEEK